MLGDVALHTLGASAVPLAEICLSVRNLMAQTLCCWRKSCFQAVLICTTAICIVICVLRYSRMSVDIGGSVPATCQQFNKMPIASLPASQAGLHSLIIRLSLVFLLHLPVCWCRTAILERCLRRLEFDKARDAEAKAQADQLEAERMAMQSIDW